MAERFKQHFFIFSLLFHFIILAVLIVSFDFSAPLPVVENTNKRDVISAVVLGDSAKSKILPQQLRASKQEDFKQKSVEKSQLKKDVIAIAKKKIAEKRKQEIKKQQELLAKNLLAEIKKYNDQQKKVKQKQLKSQFEKTLHEQADESLRQQLLNEDIKLSSTEVRQSQGVVDKYKALILQAISENWIIPQQVKKNVSCELMIRVAPGGVVLDVQVTRSSGDATLDSSARAAVFKASPLPVPPDPNAFEAFRQFVLKVKPENILASDGGMSSG